MIIQTRAFGQVEIDDAKVMKFVGPLVGFEGADRYALMDLDPRSPFKVLQLTGNPDVTFLVTDPALFFPEYKVQLKTTQVADLQLTDPAKAAVMVVVTIRDGGKRLTVNLRAPIVVNAERLLGKQLVLAGTDYRVDEPLPVDSPSK